MIRNYLSHLLPECKIQGTCLSRSILASSALRTGLDRSECWVSASQRPGGACQEPLCGPGPGGAQLCYSKAELLSEGSVSNAPRQPRSGRRERSPGLPMPPPFLPVPPPWEQRTLPNPYLRRALSFNIMEGECFPESVDLNVSHTPKHPKHLQSSRQTGV